MNKYNHQQKFAQKLGFKTPGKAIIEMGVDEFKKRYKEFANPELYKIILEEINPKYTLYKNGKIHSSFYDKVLKPYKPKTKKFTPHLSYNLTLKNGKTKNYQISRLVMFYFGVHNYKKIEDMPNIIFIDGNTENIDLNNFKFDLNNEIIKKVSKEVNRKMLNCKIPHDAVFFIQNALKNEWNLKKIASIFNVSDMSVHRFIKRHNLTVSS